MIRLKAYKVDRWVYVRADAIIAIRGDAKEDLVQIEIAGKTDPLLIQGPLEDVMAQLGF